MIELRRIIQSSDKELQALTFLYREAFPEEERRDEEQLFRLIDQKEEMVFNAIESEGQLAGLFVYWKWKDFYYLEHLAVYPELRNQKIGQQLLDYVSTHLKGDRFLEVEPPLNEMAGRRISYYQRNGYEVVEKNYEQPSYDGKRKGLPLWIMCNHKEVNPENAIQIIKEEAYRKNYR